MPGFTNAAETEFLKLVTGQATTVYTSTPVAPYLSLWTVAPAEDGTGGTEVTGASYARVNASGKFAAPTAGEPSTVTTNAEVAFPTATANYPAAVAAVGLHAGSSGALVAVMLVTKTIDSGDTPRFAAGALTFSAQ